jgi:hypothetical protein
MSKLILSDKAIEALSYVIVTATEGGMYTRDNFRKWTKYIHRETDRGFYAEVTVYPSEDSEMDSKVAVHLTPQALGERLNDVARKRGLDIGHVPMMHILRLLAGDEDIAGEMDVIDAGNALQLAVYGDIIFG